MSAPGTLAYDAKADAATFSNSLRSWANIGFLRGLSGTRQEMIPGGEMKLPSAVFHSKAMASIDLDNPDSKEKENRERYINEVMAILTERQAHYIEQHYQRSILGHIVDFGAGLVVIALIAGLFWTYGAFHPISLSIVGLLGLKLIFLFISVRRMIRIAQSTFTTRAAAIRIPWTANGNSNQIGEDQAKA